MDSGPTVLRFGYMYLTVLQQEKELWGAKSVSVLHPWSREHMELQREAHSLGEECTRALYFRVSYGLVCEGSRPSMSQGPVSLTKIF